MLHRRVGEPQRAGHHGHLARRGVWQAEGELARLRLRVGEHTVHRVDRAAGDTGRFERGDPVVHRLPADGRAQQRGEFEPVAHAIGIAQEPGIVRERRQAQHVAQPLVLTVVSGGHDDAAVAGAEGLVGHDARVPVADARRDLARHQVVHRLVREVGHLNVEQREVDVLATPGGVARLQRGQHGDGCVLSGHDVGHRDAGLQWPATGHLVRFAGDAHQPAHALYQEVVARAFAIGAGLSEAGDRAVDQPRACRGERRVVEAVLREPADLVVLEQDVGLRGELTRDGPAFLGRDVQGDRLLAAVGGQEVRRLARGFARGVPGERRAPAPGIVARAGALDLDHFGAQVGEVLAAPGAGQNPRQVQHPASVQRTIHRGLPSRSLHRRSRLRVFIRRTRESRSARGRGSAHGCRACPRRC